MCRILSLAFLLSSGRSYSANPAQASSRESQQQGAQAGWMERRQGLELEAAGMRHQRFSELIHQPRLCSQGSGGVSSPSYRPLSISLLFNALTVKHIQEPGHFKDVAELAHILLYLVAGQRCRHKHNPHSPSQGTHLYHWEI